MLGQHEKYSGNITHVRKLPLSVLEILFQAIWNCEDHPKEESRLNFHDFSMPVASILLVMKYIT